MTLLTHAKQYIDRGWSVIPISGNKRPPSGFLWTPYQERIAKPAELKQWFSVDGHKGIAAVFGEVSGGLASRDFDDAETYKTWAEDYYEWASVLPTVKTARGCHVYFRLRQDSPLYGKNTVNYKDGELRLSNCYCLLPPSLHPSGSVYEWIIPLPPGDLIEIDPCEIGMEGELTVLRDDKGEIPALIPSGQRNATLARIAGIMRRPGLSEGAISAALHKENADRCDPPLPDAEIDAIARSIAQYQPAPIIKPYVSVRMDQVPREEIQWLWKPWLPLGKLTILDGDPKTGKTTLALQFAAILSRGWPFPSDNGKPGPAHPPSTSVILCAEDGLGDTLGKRLDQVGADCSKIHAMTAVRVLEGAKIKDQMVTLADIEAIEALIVDTKAAFIVIDPIQAYIGARVNTDKANETRPILQRLAALGTRQKCAILIIRHRRKSGGGALEGGMGSVDFAAAARSVMVAVRDPEDPKHKRVLAHTACNLAAEANSLKYEILDPDGFAWCGEDARSADELCEKPATQKQSAAKTKQLINWLRDLLESVGGKMPSNEVRAKARREGWTEYATRQAKNELGITSEKIGPLGYWILPGTSIRPEPQPPESEQTEFPPIDCGG